jgi:hypothetical protein
MSKWRVRELEKNEQKVTRCRLEAYPVDIILSWPVLYFIVVVSSLILYHRASRICGEPDEAPFYPRPRDGPEPASF